MPLTRRLLLTLLGSLLGQTALAPAVLAGDGSPVVIDMPPPPGGQEPSTYQDHQNGDVALGALALARYSGGRTWPMMTTPRWGGPNVVGDWWASSFPPFGGGYWSAATWGYPSWGWNCGWGRPFYGYGWSWPRRWRGGYGVWGYPRWGVGRVSPARAVRGPSRSFRLQPFR